MYRRIRAYGVNLAIGFSCASPRAVCQEKRSKGGQGVTSDAPKERQDPPAASAALDGEQAKAGEVRSEKTADKKTEGHGEYGFDEGATDMDRTIFRTLEMLSKVRLLEAGSCCWLTAADVVFGFLIRRKFTPSRVSFTVWKEPRLGYGGSPDVLAVNAFFHVALWNRRQSGAEMEGQEAAAMEAGGEDIMRQMMGEFEKMGEKEASRGFG